MPELKGVSTMKRINELGIYAKVEDGKIYSAKTLENGPVELGEDKQTPNWVEVTKPESQDWLDKVNLALHTDIKFDGLSASAASDEGATVETSEETSSDDSSSDSASKDEASE